jgi:hypothetical protein
MKRLVLALTMAALPATAQDFSEGSEAKSWNLFAEAPATFEAKVVDVLCEIAGDCAEACGGGNRQLGLLRSVDDVLVLPNKNGQPAFSGAAVDLAPYCNQTVQVDGLLIEDEDLGARNVYLVQRVRTADGTWAQADQFTKVWEKNHPDAEGKGPWFRRDPRVNAAIAADGYLGLGTEQDEAFISEYFE